jgi:hypothetical protein
MLRQAIGHARLMRESTDRIRTALQSSDVKEQLVARRILENPGVWQQWESEHSNLMRKIADHGPMRMQITVLKQTSFRLLHGKALFQYLRDSEIRGTQRVQILAHFRPGRSYENAVVAEHAVYVSKACSYLCASHVGSDVVQDAAFLDPMQRYEELFAEYFDLYCRSIVAQDGESGSQLALLPLLKHELNQWRAAILDPRGAQPFIRRDAELHLPAGDTQRLPVLGQRSKDRRR